jgi:hypothetical protein
LGYPVSKVLNFMSAKGGIFAYKVKPFDEGAIELSPVGEGVGAYSTSVQLKVWVLLKHKIVNRRF